MIKNVRIDSSGLVDFLTYDPNTTSDTTKQSYVTFKDIVKGITFTTNKEITVRNIYTYIKNLNYGVASVFSRKFYEDGVLISQNTDEISANAYSASVPFNELLGFTLKTSKIYKLEFITSSINIGIISTKGVSSDIASDNTRTINFKSFNNEDLPWMSILEKKADVTPTPIWKPTQYTCLNDLKPPNYNKTTISLGDLIDYFNEQPV